MARPTPVMTSASSGNAEYSTPELESNAETRFKRFVGTKKCEIAFKNYRRFLWKDFARGKVLSWASERRIACDILDTTWRSLPESVIDDMDRSFMPLDACKALHDLRGSHLSQRSRPG